MEINRDEPAPTYRRTEDEIEGIERRLQELKTFSKELANDQLDLNKLRDAFKEMEVDLEQVQRLRPVSKARLPYHYTGALPNISMAVRLKPKVNRIHKSNATDTPEEETTPEPLLVTQRKAPEIVIPKFEGDVTAHASFIKAFQLKFDKLTISDAERLQHLKTSIDLEPKKMIGNLELNDQNYLLALEIPDQEYNKSEMVIFGLYHKINNNSIKRCRKYSIQSPNGLLQIGRAAICPSSSWARHQRYSTTTRSGIL